MAQIYQFRRPRGGSAMATIYQCDVCGRHCSRLHKFVACGLEGASCDDCYQYDTSAYDEDPDPLLYPEDPKEREDEERRAYFDQHDRREP